MVYGIYNELVTGANLNQLITGGPHIVPIQLVGDDPPLSAHPAWAPHHAGWEDGCPRRHCAGADDQTHQEHHPPRHGSRGMDITNTGLFYVHRIWANYNISPTWIVGPFVDDFQY